MARIEITGDGLNFDITDANGTPMEDVMQCSLRLRKGKPAELNIRLVGTEAHFIGDAALSKRCLVMIDKVLKRFGYCVLPINAKKGDTIEEPDPEEYVPQEDDDV